jgi:hypothetical protein
VTRLDDPMTLPQGDLGLLETDLAQRLLASTELARVAYVAKDGTPRVFPMLFHWTGSEVVLPTFGGLKVNALRARPDIAITIDDAATPPSVLLIRGKPRSQMSMASSPNTHWPSTATPAKNRAPRTSQRSTSPARPWSASPSGPHGSASWTSSPASPAARPPTSSLSEASDKEPGRNDHTRPGFMHAGFMHTGFMHTDLAQRAVKPPST